MESVQLMQRVYAHTRLCIGQIDGCLESEPKIREPIGKPALAIHVLVRKLA